MKTRWMICTAAVAAALLGGAERAAAITTAAFSLGVPQISGSTATIDVTLDYTSDPGDDTVDLELIQLSLIGSSDALTGAGNNFSRFSFALNTTAAPLNEWIILLDPTIDPSFGLVQLGPSDPLNGPFITQGSSLLLGQLSVNLSGLAGNSSVLVSLAGGTDSADATDVVGHTVTAPPTDTTDAIVVEGLDLNPPFSFVDTVDDPFTVDTSAAEARFITPDSGAAVPEPITASLGALSLAALGLAMVRRPRAELQRTF